MDDPRTSPMFTQLKAEMRLLKWHKLANETALQAALLSTKQIKQQDKILKMQSSEQDRLKIVERKKIIVNEELTKPLQVCFLDFSHSFVFLNLAEFVLYASR